jgi:hypothetical protein
VASVTASAIGLTTSYHEIDGFQAGNWLWVFIGADDGASRDDRWRWGCGLGGGQVG